jgi:POT family proton-dependent oligopeptide transporter
MSDSAALPSTPAKKGHPLGLYVLFGTEMWERFNYYGMRALLVLYLINELKWQPEQSSSVYKWFTSLVYLTPLLGGFLADRLIGLRLSIMIGAVLMAIGQFTLAFGGVPLFYLALAFIIAGNGFFKPNISTLVGRMYVKNDARRDGAFTIFYMGINLGALLAPIVCGGLRRHYGFSWGFCAAGVGMILGFLMFTFGLPRIAKDVAAAGNTMGLSTSEPAAPEPKKEGAQYREPAMHPAEVSDDDKPAASGSAHIVALVLPILMIAVAVLLPGYLSLQVILGKAKLISLFMPFAFSAISAWMGVTLLRIKGAARDKSTVIFALFFFVVLFWMAFEQAGNTLNIWADIHTKPGLLEAEDYQAVNPAFIILFGLGTVVVAYVGSGGKGMSTPFKMFIALLLCAASFGAMVAAGAAENATVTNVPLASIPERVKQALANQPTELAKEDGVNTGRLAYDGKALSTHGVVPSYLVSSLLVAGAPEEVAKKFDAVKKGKASIEVSPDYGFLMDPKKAKEKGVTYDAETHVVEVKEKVDDSIRIDLVGGASPPEWRTALKDLREKSLSAQVSGWWLILSYLLATLGELLLSPVGLSMVTKLAPARFASLFMGVWMLCSSVAQYAGGSIGELWTKMTPTTYFEVFVGSSLLAALILAGLVVPLRKLMHEVV